MYYPPGDRDRTQEHVEVRTKRRGSVAFATLAGGSVYIAIIWTQARPAIEFVSGEEGLRPKSYFFEYSFLEYVFTDIQKYAKAPGPF